jgi:hypothetical protein
MSKYARQSTQRAWRTLLPQTETDAATPTAFAYPAMRADLKEVLHGVELPDPHSGSKQRCRPPSLFTCFAAADRS